MNNTLNSTVLSAVRALFSNGHLLLYQAILWLGLGLAPDVQAASGTLSNSDADSHGVTGGKADFYRLTGNGSAVLTLTSGAFDAQLFLYDQNKQLLASNDNGAGGTNAKISHTLTSGRTYYVEVTSTSASGRGAYSLKTFRGTLATTGTPWPPPQLAPTSLVGKYVIVASSGGSSSALFFGKTSVAIDLPVGVGSYTYSKLSRTKAQITISISAPSFNAGRLTIVATFATPSSGTYVMTRASDHKTFQGTFSLDDQRSTLPSSLAQHSVEMHDAEGLFWVYFTSSKAFSTSNGGSGTYTYYKTCGPQACYIRLNFVTPSKWASRSGYVVAVFGFPTEGHYGIAYPVTPTSLHYSSTGWFIMH